MTSHVTGCRAFSAPGDIDIVKLSAEEGEEAVPNFAQEVREMLIDQWLSSSVVDSND